MKLKTKIMWISSIAVFIALLISDIIIYTLVKQSYIDEAVADAVNDYQQVINRFELASREEVGKSITKQKAVYILKEMRDPYNICYDYVVNYDGDVFDYKEIYNNTIFTHEQLAGMNYEYTEREYMYTFYTYGNSHYIVFDRTNELSDICLYRVADISYVWNKLSILIAGMVVIMVAVILVVIFIEYKIINKVLRPLRELNWSAGKIAAGEYQYRIHIETPDEIGQLTENFNKMAEAVEARTRHLEESEYRKTLFMGDLTHELKTPMTAISGYAQTLLTTKLSEENKEEALLFIYQECGRLERLSKKMMKLLELDQEEALELSMVSASRLFEGVSMSCKEILKNKDIELVCEENGESYNVDEDLIIDALINLVDNAVKASEPNSKIILRAKDNSITVQDFGRGIPKEEQDKILEPFYMVDKSRSRKSGGAGLGLALTATILDKHNCKLNIESELGEGTCMNLQFV